MTSAPLIHRYREFLRLRFGGVVRKVSVDAGFTCPNRDGTSGTLGCSFCVPPSFIPRNILSKKGIREQLAAGIQAMRRHHPDAQWLAYFQPYTNTHAPVETLRALYEEALGVPGVVGIAIGTRPDCLSDAVLDLLAELSRLAYIQLEIGLQTANDETLGRIGRGHTVADFVSAVERAKQRGLTVGAHVIVGLPGEGRADAHRTAALLGALGVDLVKIHNFYLVRGSRMAEEGEVPDFLTKEDHVSIVADMLERLPWRVVIERVGASVTRDVLCGPDWAANTSNLYSLVEKELAARGVRQGSFEKDCIEEGTESL